MMNRLARFRSPRSGTRRRRVAVACGMVAALSVCGVASAQFGPSIELPPGLPTVMPAPVGGYPPTVATTAAVPYYAPPAWSQTLAPNVRFVILSTFHNDAVLARETGLAWARHSVLRIHSSIDASTLGEFAEGYCRAFSIGSRFGWRLPAVAELQSLIDASQPVTSGPRLPAGHPFLLSPGGLNTQNRYWTGEVYDLFGSFLRRGVTLHNGFIDDFFVGEAVGDALCVRGGSASVPDSEL